MQKMTRISGRWNSKFWGYLWWTSDGSLPEPHIIRLRNIKMSQFLLLSSEKSMLIKRFFSQRKWRKCPFFSGHWNSKFWGYLWRTSDGLHREPHKPRLRNIKISPFFLLSSEKGMLRKRVQYVGIWNFEFICEEEVIAYIENHTNHDFDT
jgi:hypothetical protein